MSDSISALPVDKNQLPTATELALLDQYFPEPPQPVAPPTSALMHYLCSTLIAGTILLPIADRIILACYDAGGGESSVWVVWLVKFILFALLNLAASRYLG